jgi:hypothetical protein
LTKAGFNLRLLSSPGVMLLLISETVLIWEPRDIAKRIKVGGGNIAKKDF